MRRFWTWQGSIETPKAFGRPPVWTSGPAILGSGGEDANQVEPWNSFSLSFGAACQRGDEAVFQT
jgi:hypothetical protein